jgi:2-keto-myo-inositol isomerase
MCFGSPGARISNLKANAANAELIRDLGADKMIVGTDGPEQVALKELDAVARAVWNLAEFTEDLGVDSALTSPSSSTGRRSSRASGAR